MTIDRVRQAQKARALLELHRGPRMLVLPNVWDPLGARMLEVLGFPAVATASSSVAYSLGYLDGEHVGFETMLGVIERIASCVSVPMTADIERGYSETLDGLAANIRRVIDAGAVGVNLEDSTFEGGPLRAIEEQAERIRAVRDAADGEGVPIVINARIDTYLSRVGNSDKERLAETIARGRAYADAGASCLYPITLDDIDSLKRLRAETGAPINVYARKGTPPMLELEAAGVARLSLGPGLQRASVAAIKRVAEELLRYGSYDEFTGGVDAEPFVSRSDHD